MSKLKVQMKPKAQSEKCVIFDFLADGKTLTFCHLSFIGHLDIKYFYRILIF